MAALCGCLRDAGAAGEATMADTTSESSGQSTARRQGWMSAMKKRGRSWVAARRVNMAIDKRTLAEEMSGSLGDMGSFIPVVIALVMVNGLDLGTTLFFTGVFNIVTGLLFGIPMPVQPMKSIAAAAIKPADPFTIPEIMAAGLSVSFVLLFLSFTGLMSFVTWLVPLSVVRGVQMSQGLSFAITAVKYILNEQHFNRARQGRDRPWVGLDGRILAVAAFCFVVGVTGVGGGFVAPLKPPPSRSDLEEGSAAAASAPPEEQAQAQAEAEASAGTGAGATKKWNKGSLQAFLKESGGDGKVFVIPTALLLLVLGVLLAFIKSPKIFHSLRVGPSKPRVVHIHLRDWKAGFMRGAIPQLPITLLDSIIATVKLANDLFPGQSKVSVFRVATSAGFMNILGCWFGAMPVCHASSGLAGQYRFGARTGFSVALLGSVKVVISLFLGGSLIKVLAQFPVSLLGVMLLFSGLELAMAARDQRSRTDAFIMLLVTAVSIAWSNTSYGFLAGMTVAWILKIREVDLEALRQASSDPLPDSPSAHISPR